MKNVIYKRNEHFFAKINMFGQILSTFLQHAPKLNLSSKRLPLNFIYH